jgi:hypothetical protein
MKNIVYILLFFGMTCNGQVEKSAFIATYGGVIENGYLAKEKINTTDSLVLFVSNLKVQSAKIISFTICIVVNGFSIEAKSDSNKISEKQRQIINKVGINESFYIEMIKVKFGDNVAVTNNNLKITVDGKSACVYRCPSKANKAFMYLNDSTFLSVNPHGQEVIYTGNGISRQEFLNNDFLFIKNPETRSVNEDEVDLKSKIISYNCHIRVFDKENVSKDFKFIIQGDLISNEIKSIIKKYDNVEFIDFSQIKAVDENKQEIEIGDLKLYFDDCYSR